MQDFADNVKVAEDAMLDMGTQAGTTAQDVVVADKEILKAEKQLTTDWATERATRLQDAKDQMAAEKLLRDEAAEAEAKALQDQKDANKKFRDDELEANKTSWGITDVEYKVAQASLETLSADKYAALIEQSEAFGIEDLALLMAHNRNLAQAQIAADNARITAAQETMDTLIAIASSGNAEITQRHVDGSGQSGKEAPAPTNATGGAIVWASDSGGRIQFQTANSGRDIYSVRDFPHRRGDVMAWLAENAPAAAPVVAPAPVVASAAQHRTQAEIDAEQKEYQERLRLEYEEQQRLLALNAPAAQHGAFVKGSRMGSLVRVGENYTDENITPVGGRGSGSGGGGKMEFAVNLGGETLATIYVEGKRVAVREGRE